MKIKVNYLSVDKSPQIREEVEIEIASSETVGFLKRKISARCGIPLEWMYIRTETEDCRYVVPPDGNCFFDSSVTLNDVGVKENQTLKITYYGGYYIEEILSFKFVDNLKNDIAELPKNKDLQQKLMDILSISIACRNTGHYFDESKPDRKENALSVGFTKKIEYSSVNGLMVYMRSGTIRDGFFWALKNAGFEPDPCQRKLWKDQHGNKYEAVRIIPEKAKDFLQRICELTPDEINMLDSKWLDLSQALLKKSEFLLTKIDILERINLKVAEFLGESAESEIQNLLSAKSELEKALVSDKDFFKVYQKVENFNKKLETKLGLIKEEVLKNIDENRKKTIYMVYEFDEIYRQIDSSSAHYNYEIKENSLLLSKEMRILRKIRGSCSYLDGESTFSPKMVQQILDTDANNIWRFSMSVIGKLKFCEVDGNEVHLALEFICKKLVDYVNEVYVVNANIGVKKEWGKCSRERYEKIAAVLCKHFSEDKQLKSAVAQVGCAHLSIQYLTPKKYKDFIKNIDYISQKVKEVGEVQLNEWINHGYNPYTVCGKIKEKIYAKLSVINSILIAECFKNYPEAKGFLELCEKLNERYCDCGVLPKEIEKAEALLQDCHQLEKEIEDFIVLKTNLVEREIQKVNTLVELYKKENIILPKTIKNNVISMLDVLKDKFGSESSVSSSFSSTFGVLYTIAEPNKETINKLTLQDIADVICGSAHNVQYYLFEALFPVVEMKNKKALNISEDLQGFITQYKNELKTNFRLGNDQEIEEKLNRAYLVHQFLKLYDEVFPKVLHMYHISKAFTEKPDIIHKNVKYANFGMNYPLIFFNVFNQYGAILRCTDYKSFVSTLELYRVGYWKEVIRQIEEEIKPAYASYDISENTKLFEKEKKLSLEAINRFVDEYTKLKNTGIKTQKLEIDYQGENQDLLQKSTDADDAKTIFSKHRRIELRSKMFENIKKEIEAEVQIREIQQQLNEQATLRAKLTQINHYASYINNIPYFGGHEIRLKKLKEALGLSTAFELTWFDKVSVKLRDNTIFKVKNSLEECHTLADDCLDMLESDAYQSYGLSLGLVATRQKKLLDDINYFMTTIKDLLKLESDFVSPDMLKGINIPAITETTTVEEAQTLGKEKNKKLEPLVELYKRLKNLMLDCRRLEPDIVKDKNFPPRITSLAELEDYLKLQEKESQKTLINSVQKINTMVEFICRRNEEGCFGDEYKKTANQCRESLGLKTPLMTTWRGRLSIDIPKNGYFELKKPLLECVQEANTYLEKLNAIKNDIEINTNKDLGRDKINYLSGIKDLKNTIEKIKSLPRVCSDFDANIDFNHFAVDEMQANSVGELKKMYQKKQAELDLCAEKLKQIYYSYISLENLTKFDANVLPVDKNIKTLPVLEQFIQRQFDLFANKLSQMRNKLIDQHKKYLDAVEILKAEQDKVNAALLLPKGSYKNSQLNDLKKIKKGLFHREALIYFSFFLEEGKPARNSDPEVKTKNLLPLKPYDWKPGGLLDPIMKPTFYTGKYFFNDHYKFDLLLQAEYFDFMDKLEELTPEKIQTILDEMELFKNTELSKIKAEHEQIKQLVLEINDTIDFICNAGFSSKCFNEEDTHSANEIRKLLGLSTLSGVDINFSDWKTCLKIELDNAELLKLEKSPEQCKQILQAHLQNLLNKKTSINTEKDNYLSDCRANYQKALNELRPKLDEIKQLLGVHQSFGCQYLNLILENGEMQKIKNNYTKKTQDINQFKNHLEKKFIPRYKKLLEFYTDNEKSEVERTTRGQPLIFTCDLVLDGKVLATYPVKTEKGVREVIYAKVEYLKREKEKMTDKLSELIAHMAEVKRQLLKIKQDVQIYKDPALKLPGFELLNEVDQKLALLDKKSKLFYKKTTFQEMHEGVELHRSESAAYDWTLSGKEYFDIKNILEMTPKITDDQIKNFKQEAESYKKMYQDLQAKKEQLKLEKENELLEAERARKAEEARRVEEARLLALEQARIEEERRERASQQLVLQSIQERRVKLEKEIGQESFIAPSEESVSVSTLIAQEEDRISELESFQYARNAFEASKVVFKKSCETEETSGLDFSELQKASLGESRREYGKAESLASKTQVLEAERKRLDALKSDIENQKKAYQAVIEAEKLFKKPAVLDEKSEKIKPKKVEEFKKLVEEKEREVSAEKTRQLKAKREREEAEEKIREAEEARVREEKEAKIKAEEDREREVSKLKEAVKKAEDKIKETRKQLEETKKTLGVDKDKTKKELFRPEEESIEAAAKIIAAQKHQLASPDKLSKEICVKNIQEVVKTATSVQKKQETWEKVVQQEEASKKAQTRYKKVMGRGYAPAEKADKAIKTVEDYSAQLESQNALIESAVVKVVNEKQEKCEKIRVERANHVEKKISALEKQREQLKQEGKKIEGLKTQNAEIKKIQSTIAAEEKRLEAFSQQLKAKKETLDKPYTAESVEAQVVEAQKKGQPLNPALFEEVLETAEEADELSQAITKSLKAPLSEVEKFAAQKRSYVESIAGSYSQLTASHSSVLLAIPELFTEEERKTLNSYREALCLPKDISITPAHINSALDQQADKPEKEKPSEEQLKKVILAYQSRYESVMQEYEERKEYRKNIASAFRGFVVRFGTVEPRNEKMRKIREALYFPGAGKLNDASVTAAIENLARQPREERMGCLSREKLIEKMIQYAEAEEKFQDRQQMSVEKISTQIKTALRKISRHTNEELAEIKMRAQATAKKHEALQDYYAPKVSSWDLFWLKVQATLSTTFFFKVFFEKEVSIQDALPFEEKTPDKQAELRASYFRLADEVEVLEDQYTAIMKVKASNQQKVSTENLNKAKAKAQAASLEREQKSTTEKKRAFDSLTQRLEAIIERMGLVKERLLQYNNHGMQQIRRDFGNNLMKAKALLQHLKQEKNLFEKEASLGSVNITFKERRNSNPETALEVLGIEGYNVESDAVNRGTHSRHRLMGQTRTIGEVIKTFESDIQQISRVIGEVKVKPASSFQSSFASNRDEVNNGELRVGC